MKRKRETKIGRLRHNDGACEVERVEIRAAPGTRVEWQLDPDDNSTVIVRVG